MNLARKVIVKKNPDIQPDPHDPNFHRKSCNYTYKNRNIYQAHLCTVHLISTQVPEGSASITIDPDDVDYNCNVCFKDYFTLNRYRVHIL